MYLGDSSQILIGEDVVVMGSPQGFKGTVSKGIISASRGDLIQITAPISPGSSGGPVLNAYGEVIGIVKALYAEGLSQNINFAIPINFIKHK